MNKHEGLKPIELALQLALVAHAGVTDKSGAAYILHPLRLMHRFDDAQFQIAALLHDVIEDGEITADDLLGHGFDPAVVEAIVALTRQHGESYMKFIKRLGGNHIARAVKMCDLEDNMNLLRLPNVKPADLKRAKMYHTAWRYLDNLADDERLVRLVGERQGEPTVSVDVDQLINEASAEQG